MIRLGLSWGEDSGAECNKNLIRPLISLRSNGERGKIRRGTRCWHDYND